jgi:hypothetical protein
MKDTLPLHAWCGHYFLMTTIQSTNREREREREKGGDGYRLQGMDLAHRK